MTSRQKSHVFRVTGLSTDQSDESLENFLLNTLNDELTPEERSHIQPKVTILPSCYEPETMRVALVQFRGGMPQFLSELAANPLGDWQVEMGDTDINFDSHFFGFTQLYAPPSEKPVVADIIAIAGLDGHAYGSWQGRGNLGRMWLRDFLSKDLPQCRTMIYGYNSKLSSHGIDTILDYGRELMEEIKQVRNTKELQQRPLFFVAHSFGGIILAHCLVRALQTMDDDHPAITSLYRATYGMILFAIPHKGLVIDDIQKMLSKGGNQSRQQLLQQISNKSDLLVHQLADFKNLIRDRKVVSFYETEQTRQLVFDSQSQRWKRTGDFVTTVNADSALLQLPDHVEDKVPLHADHSMIIKFDTRHEPGYRTVLDRLRQFLEDAPRVVAARFAQPRHRPPASSTVPFKRDPEFVGREGILDKIKKRHAGIGQRHDRVALIGLAGVGKSQTAIEYSYRVRESAPDMWVFWIHASNRDRFEQGYRQIASVGEIPGRDSPKTNILQLVYHWLCDLRNGQWLIVLDNADDDTVFFDADDSNSQGPLVKFLPQVTHGLILVTSRNRLAAGNLVGSYRNVIDISPMDEEESLTLLRTKIPINQQAIEDEKALVHALEHIPLAIIQAGSYIASRTTRFTVARYLHLFQESESKQTHLLKQEDAKDLRRDPSIRHSVITTWQLSFEQIRQSQPIATELLALMSMFDRQGIPEYLVREDHEALQFEDALAPLISYSLIRTGIEAKLFEMHRLVQMSVRVWLEIHEELDRMQEKSRGIMAQMLPDGDYKNWIQCQRLLPHAKEVLKSSIQNDDDGLNWASISDNCGWYLSVRGAFDEAETMHRRALQIHQKVLGPEHPSTLNSVSYLGTVLRRQGKYEEAEAMHRQAMGIRKKVLGPEQSSTLNSVNNLGLVLSDQGKYEEAEAMYRQALEGHKKVLGPEHPNTLDSNDNLGLVLKDRGEYEQAEAMHRQAMGIRKKVLGPEHSITLNSVDNLGLVLRRRGKYEEAEAMYRQVLEGHKKVLGPEHPSTLNSVNNLCIVLRKQAKHEEAEAMHQQVSEQ